MNELELLSGKDLVLSKDIRVKHFTLNDIREAGIDNYYKYLSLITLSVLDVADVLWCEKKVWYKDAGSDWDFFVQRALSGANSKKNIVVEKGDKVVDVELNCMCVNEEYKKALNFFFGWDYDYLALNIHTGDRTQTILTTIEYEEDSSLYILKEKTIRITEHHYRCLVDFVKDINWIHKEYMFLKGGNKRAQKYILENEYKNRKYTNKETINLESIISSLIAKGVNYLDIWNYPIYLVYNQYYRFNKIVEYQNIITAYYSGCLDTKKNPIKWDELNWSSIIKR